ncbi:hypothetical protein HD806DRAFT_270493 [Xylariaceae sp. AK1471]|nr:hypothetical protein HD806DRAFT_270493 [Xylariaceae sp. AK1471]
MSPPLPVPSKAAIHALRGIALGTSCAIGVIVEDRRRRISTLRTAVANKEKLKSSRKYHQASLEQLSWQFDDAVVVGHNLQWHERDNEFKNRHNEEATDHSISSVFETHERRASSQEQNDPNPPQIPKSSRSKSLSSQPIIPSPDSSPVSKHQMRTSLLDRPISNIPVGKEIGTSKMTPSAPLRRHQKPVIITIENLLASKDEERLDRAVPLFISHSPTIPSSPLLNRWLELSVRLSKECQASGRWEYASQILASIIDFGPLDEAQYFAYDPLPIIEFHLRRRQPNTQRSTESLTSAAKLFLATFKEKHQARGTDMERIGRLLILEAMSLQNFKIAHDIYRRVLGWADNPETFVRWAIHTFFEHKDHKIVLKIFLSQYSHMKPPANHFNTTLDCVVGSVQALRGLSATPVLAAFARMECPEDNKLRTRWIMKLLQAHWSRYEDLSRTTKVFEIAMSLGLLDKVPHPEGVHCTMVEIAVKAGDEEMAHAYAGQVIREYPAMKDDIALRLVLFKAKAGDWDGVLETFRQVRLSGLVQPAACDDSFIVILRVFAECHSAAETRDFAMLFIRDLGFKFHPYMVTLVAKKYGEYRDMNGFMAWLKQCSREGFALDAGFCNSVLYNCWAIWKVSFPELRMIHLKLQALNPHCSDEVTQRILSQAAHREGKVSKEQHRVRSKAIGVSKMAYSGRSANRRDIYEAMNQGLMKDKPSTTVWIYKRAMQFGMPFSSHCLRLAVLAALRQTKAGSGHALSLIQDAHTQGHDVGHAVATFIKCQIDEFRGNAEDVIIHMRNLISRFESSQIAIGPAVLTHMATVCVKIGQHEKAVALCNLARDRGGFSHLCFSTKSFKALSTAYSQMLDFRGMDSLISDLYSSQILTDRVVLRHLRSVRRLVQKMSPSNARTALLEVIERGIHQATEARAEARTQGKLISEEVLRIVGDALANLENSETDENMSQLRAVTDGTRRAVSTELPRQLEAVG